VESLRGGRPFPDLTGQAAILIDDGLASGFTMRVAIEAVRKAAAKEVIVAVPTAHIAAARSIEDIAEAVYCANIRHARPFAVAEAYRNWYDVEESEAKALITLA